MTHLFWFYFSEGDIFSRRSVTIKEFRQLQPELVKKIHIDLLFEIHLWEFKPLQ